MKGDPNIHIIENGETGIMLLLIATFFNAEEEPVIINNSCIKKFKKKRHNLASKIETTSSFGSMGNFYGIGLVGHYIMNNNLSFGRYSNKKN